MTEKALTLCHMRAEEPCIENVRFVKIMLARRCLPVAAMIGLSVLTGFSGLWRAGLSWASGFQIRENSATGLGTAFAGAGSAADDLSTIFNNPAGMTRLGANKAEAVLNFIAPSAVFEGGASLGGARVAGTASADGGDTVVVPAFYALYSLSPEMKFGVAITSPFGLRTTYPDNWVGRYAAIDSELTSININPNLAYRLTDTLSVAGGLVAQRLEAKESNAINFSGIGAPDGFSQFSGDGWGYGLDGGLLFEPTQSTRFGLTYRSQIAQTLRGRASFRDIPAPVLALDPALSNQDAHAELRTPATLTASLYHELTPRLALMADAQWTHWSSFKNFGVFSASRTLLANETENWGDSWFTAAGVKYRYNDFLTLRTGFAYDATPVKDVNRNARLPDNDRFWLALGFTRTLAPGVDLTGGYAHLFAGNPTINEPFGNSLFGSGTLTGSYSDHIDIVSLALTASF